MVKTIIIVTTIKAIIIVIIIFFIICIYILPSLDLSLYIVLKAFNQKGCGLAQRLTNTIQMSPPLENLLWMKIYPPKHFLSLPSTALNVQIELDDLTQL